MLHKLPLADFSENKFTNSIFGSPRVDRKTGERGSDKEKRHHQKHRNSSHSDGTSASEAKHCTMWAPPQSQVTVTRITPQHHHFCPWKLAMAVTTAETSEFSTGPGLLGIMSFRMPGKSISSAKSHAQLLACYRAWDFTSGFLASIVVDWLRAPQQEDNLGRKGSDKRLLNGQPNMNVLGGTPLPLLLNTNIVTPRHHCSCSCLCKWIGTKSWLPEEGAVEAFGPSGFQRERQAIMFY